MVQALNMAPLPTPLRAAIGLMANAVDVARTLPERAVELPVLAVSTALQVSLRAQQRYAEWTLRGDELLARLHEPPEEPPPWATFDDEEPVPATAEPAGHPATTATTPERPDASAAPPAPGEPAPPAPREPATDAAREPATDASATPAGAAEPTMDERPAGTADPPEPASDVAAARAPSPDDPATGQDEPPDSPDDERSQSGTVQPPARKTPVRKTTAAAAKTATTKTVRAPRQVKPSAFDRTDDHD